MSIAQRLFDVHTHVQFHAFKDDADLVIRRALEQGIWMVNVGTQKDTSEAAVRLAEKYSEGVYASVGLHPIHTEVSYHDEQELGSSFAEASEDKGGGFTPLEARAKGAADTRGVLPLTGFTSRGETFDPIFYRKLAEHPKVVAIGECGFDYYRLGEETKEKQKSAFLQQVELAHEVQKPLMIHCRSAFSDLISELKAKSYKLLANPGIIHFFSGTVDDARSFLDLGFSFSFGGVITFARDYDDVVKFIPLDRILLETDAPYVTPAPYRGKRNEPAYIVEVAKKITEVKGVSLEDVMRETFTNACRLFSL